MDMQLADFISLCASKEGSTPQNVSADRVAQALHGTASSGDSFGVSCPVLSEGSLLCGVLPDRVVARASLLRVANQTLRYALPYINMTLLEEKQRRDCFGSDDAIDIDPTPIPPKDSDCTSAQSAAPPLFAPPSSARRLRALRRLLFGHTKNRCDTSHHHLSLSRYISTALNHLSVSISGGQLPRRFFCSHASLPLLLFHFIL
jgi:hypothetical protein